MTARTKYSRELRDRLRKELGGKCAHCQKTEHLQFDCRVSQGPDHHVMQWRQRLNFYRDQHKRGNLQLLCPACHTRKTLNDIAARHLKEAHVRCPYCAKHFRVRDQLALQAELEHGECDGCRGLGLLLRQAASASGAPVWLCAACWALTPSNDREPLPVDMRPDVAPGGPEARSA